MTAAWRPPTLGSWIGEAIVAGHAEASDMQSTGVRATEAVAVERPLFQSRNKGDLAVAII